MRRTLLCALAALPLPTVAAADPLEITLGGYLEAYYQAHFADPSRRRLAMAMVFNTRPRVALFPPNVTVGLRATGEIPPPTVSGGESGPPLIYSTPLPSQRCALQPANAQRYP